MDRPIPIVADALVDPAFGTGAVKVTPAHDANDFEMGQRHSLPPLVIMDTDGRINDERRPLRRPRPLRGAQADRRRPRGARPAREDRAVPRAGAALRALRHGDRAVPVGAMVRAHGAAGGAGHRGGAQRPPAPVPGALGRRLPALDGEHPRLVHQPPAVVGPPHSRLVLRRLRPADGGAHRSDRVQPLPQRHRSARTPTCSTPGSARGCGRSRRWAGRRTRRRCAASIRPTR